MVNISRLALVGILNLKFVWFSCYTIIHVEKERKIICHFFIALLQTEFLYILSERSVGVFQGSLRF